MDQATERELLQRCLQHLQAGSTQQGEAVQRSPVERYLDSARFEREREALFRRRPMILAHVSELSAPQSYVLRPTPAGELLLCRDDTGQIQAFHNVCRHRGARLVTESAGCAERFRCPYHAWTYARSGELVGVPHQASAFPELDRQAHGLQRVGVVEAHGFIWRADSASALQDWLAPVRADLDWLQPQHLRVFASEARNWAANWKLIAEGGLESYHFRQAHKATIADFFADNCSLVEALGPHFRSVLPKRSLLQLATQPQANWSLREHVHMTYALFPTETLLVQRDHIAWIQALPVAVDDTCIRVTTLVPQADQPHGQQSEDYWRTNHRITGATLDEDFALGESIQRGLASGANRELLFGRNEAALAEFNRVVDRGLSA